ncbi:hypothetical protein AA0X95_16910 [Bacillus sp. 1P10SD]|uniref:hypothetical protein n=1 Tax=Bacillus sp. 1P10SD TaxID=3132265 RepID=UPI0039A606EA
MELLEDFILFDHQEDWENGNQVLYHNGLTDGLPVILPTRKKLEKMLETVSDKFKNYGLIPPLFREVTPTNVAYQAVLAGCQPEEFPVVLTAVAAALDPQFNLLGIQTTTGTTTTAVMVHGPITKRLGMNAGPNCLGPGNRVNACIGRAVQLTMTNLGGAKPGTTDMATIGQPGKYTFCFAESPNTSPIPFFHTRKGYKENQSAVTVLGVSGTVEIVEMSSRPEAILLTLAGSLQNAGNISADRKYLGSGELFILIPPEIMDALHKGGWNLDSIQQYVFQHAKVPLEKFSKETQEQILESAVPIAKTPKDIYPIVSGGIGRKMTYLQTWAGGTDAITLPLVE